MIEFEKHERDSAIREKKEIEQLREEFRSEYMQMLDHKSSIKEYIDSTLMNQKYITSQIKHTDMLIQSRLFMDQRKQAQLQKDSHLKRTEVFNRETREKRKKELEKETQQQKVEFERFKEIFLLNDGDLNRFDEAQEFKELTGALDTKKNLEQSNYEKAATAERLKLKVKQLNEEKDVVASHADPRTRAQAKGHHEPRAGR